MTNLLNIFFYFIFIIFLTFFSYYLYSFIYLQLKFSKSAKIIYRKHYLSLIQRIENLVLKLNKMNHLLYKITNKQLLEQYEYSIKLIENILTIMTKIKPFDTNLQILKSAHVIVKEGEKRISNIYSMFMTFIKTNKSHSVLNKTKIKNTPIPIGCYFCSRPFPYNGFFQVKIRIDNEVKKVYSCSICKDTLEKEKSVKVLFFIRDGKPVHWSEVPEYNPIQHYWDLNNPKRFVKTTKLELIKSNNENKNE